MPLQRASTVMPFTLPASGSWAGKLTDSIGDDSIPYGQYYDSVCAHFGWNEINSNLIPNGSFEADATDSFAEFIGTGGSIARSTVQHYHGAASLLFTGPTATGLAYFNVGGAAPTALIATMAGSGSAQTVASVAGTGGGGYLGSIMTYGAGGATFALAVNAAGAIVSVKIINGGSGYANGTNLSAVTLTDGSGATFTIVTAGAIVTSVAVVTGGSGYVPSPVCNIGTNAGGSGAVIIPYIAQGGGMQGAFVSAAGSGFSGAPTLTVTTLRPQTRAYQAAPMTAGKKYLFGARIFVPTGGVPVANVSISVVSFDALGNPSNLASATASGAQNQWNLVSTNAFTFPSTSVAVYFRVLVTTTAANQLVYVDGVQLTPTPSGTNTFPPTYTDFVERGGIGGGTLANQTIGGSTNGNQVLVVPTNTAGSGISYVTPGGIAAAQSTMATRVTKHTAMNLLIIELGINDIAYSTAGNGGSANTLTAIATAIDAVYAAVAAMGTPPKIIALGIGQFGPAFWNVLPPAGYNSYSDYGDAVEDMIQQKAQANGALFVPLRRRMQLEAHILLDGPHWTQVGHNIVAQCIIDRIEKGL